MRCEGFDGPCDREDARRRRQNTAYTKKTLTRFDIATGKDPDEQNWRTLCDDCQRASDEYWHEMWNEYYSAINS